MFGIYGYENPETGCLNGLGFIGYDVGCMAKFFPFKSWASPIKGNAYTAEGAQSILKQQSEDYDEISGGLVAWTILTWAGVLLALIGLVVMMKKSSQVSNSR